MKNPRMCDVSYRSQFEACIPGWSPSPPTQWWGSQAPCSGPCCSVAFMRFGKDCPGRQHVCCFRARVWRGLSVGRTAHVTNSLAVRPGTDLHYGKKDWTWWTANSVHLSLLSDPPNNQRSWWERFFPLPFTDEETEFRGASSTSCVHDL